MKINFHHFPNSHIIAVDEYGNFVLVTFGKDEEPDTYISFLDGDDEPVVGKSDSRDYMAEIYTLLGVI